MVGEVLRWLTGKCLCAFFSPSAFSAFPPQIVTSHLPNLDILGASIGDSLFCAGCMASERRDVVKLLTCRRGG